HFTEMGGGGMELRGIVDRCTAWRLPAGSSLLSPVSGVFPSGEPVGSTARNRHDVDRYCTPAFPGSLAQRIARPRADIPGALHKRRTVSGGRIPRCPMGRYLGTGMGDPADVPNRCAAAYGVVLPEQTVVARRVVRSACIGRRRIGPAMRSHL